jgi:hypothetical protein
MAICATALLAAPASHLPAADPSRSALSVPDTANDDEVPIAAALLAGVVQQLPPDPIRVTGELVVRRMRGVPIKTYGFELVARWGDSTPQTQYTIRDAFGDPIEQLTLTHGSNPVVAYAAGNPLVPQPIVSLARPIQASDITWMDLTLSFLWWTDARLEGEDSVKGFDCHVIRVNAPPAQQGPYKSVRLWIGKKAGMMLRAEGLDGDDRPVRRLWINSVQKIDEAYMIKDMEIQKYPAVQRTKLSIAEVERLQP